MPLRTIVVGGGIGGLSRARELVMAGLPVVVLERAPKLGAIGAGIIMNPNAMRVLEVNGLAPCVRSRSSPYLARDTFDHRGRRLATRDYRPLYAAGRLAVGALLHRAHLHECLYDGLPAGTVHLDTRIRDLEADGQDRRGGTVDDVRERDGVAEHPLRRALEPEGVRVDERCGPPRSGGRRAAGGTGS